MPTPVATPSAWRRTQQAAAEKVFEEPDRQVAAQGNHCGRIAGFRLIPRKRGRSAASGAISTAGVNAGKLLRQKSRAVTRPDVSSAATSSGSRNAPKSTAERIDHVARCARRRHRMSKPRAPDRFPRSGKQTSANANIYEPRQPQPRTPPALTSPASISSVTARPNIALTCPPPTSLAPGRPSSNIWSAHSGRPELENFSRKANASVPGPDARDGDAVGSG